MIHVLSAMMEMEEIHALLAFHRSGYNDKRDLLRSLVDMLEISEDTQKEFNCLIVRLNAAYQIRNYVCHGVWSQGEQPGVIVPYVMKARGKIKLSGYNISEERFSAERLDAEAEKTRRLGLDLIEFASRYLEYRPENTSV